jgi:hypothetical protein
MKNFKQLLEEGPRIINIGLESFYESCKSQNADVIHVDWSPPAGGDKELIKILDKLI